MDDIATTIPKLLDDIQQNIYKKALTFRNEHITEVNTYDEMKKVLDEKGGSYQRIGMEP